MTALVEPQWMQSKRRADAVRLENAQLKRKLAGTDRPEAMRELAGLFEDPPVAFQALPVGRALRFPKRVGPAMAVAAQDWAGIRSGDRRIRDLTERQRRALAAWLRHRADLTEHDRARAARRG